MPVLSTIFRYLFMVHGKLLLQIVAIFAAVFFISSLIDILGKNKNSLVSSQQLFRIILYKLPYLIQESATFISLISTILFFDKISRSQELIALKTIGLSIWQIILPSLCLIAISGMLLLLLLNPLATTLLSISEKLENNILKKNTNISFISRNGLLIKENYDNTQKITLAKSLNLKDFKLNNISIIYLENDRFLKRIEAVCGIILDKRLELQQVSMYDENLTMVKLDSLTVDSSLSVDNIIQNFKTPEIISIWDFSKVIDQLKSFGLMNINYENYFTKLILKPFSMLTMVLFASCFINQNPRNNKNFIRLIQACIIGFVVQFSTELLANIIISFHIQPLIAHSVLLLFLSIFYIFILLSMRERLQ